MELSLHLHYYYLVIADRVLQQRELCQYRKTMNIKLIIFSGIMTALVGAVIGLAATKIGQRNFNQLEYEGQYYKGLHEKYVLIGVGLGFAVGAGQECIRELKAERNREPEQQDK